MSTTLPTTPIHPASLVPARSPLVHLCWKEIKQLLPIHLLIVLISFAGLFTLRIIPIMGGLFDMTSENPAVFWNMINVLSAVVCAAVFYGVDRDNGSWAWQSSLPLSWMLSFGSRLLTAAFCVMAVGTGSWVLMSQFIFDSSGKFDIWTSVLLGGMFWLQTYCVFSITLMLVSDVLWGLILSLGILVGLQVLLPLPTSEGTELLALSVVDAVLVPCRVGVIMSMQFVLLCLLAATHAWRWNHGCFVGLGDGIRSRLSSTGFFPTLSCGAISVAGSQNRPGLVRSLLWSTLRQYFLLRLAIFLSAIAIIFACLFSDYFRHPGAGDKSFFFLISMLLLGITVFAGDQPHNRYLSVANRGVSPELFWSIRLLVPLFVAGVVISTLFIPNLSGTTGTGFSNSVVRYPLGNNFHNSGEPLALKIGSLLFAASMFCGLCFRSQIMATIVAIVISWLFGIAVFVGFWLIPVHMLIDTGPPGWMIGIALFGLCLASLWACRRWFVLDQPRLTLSFIWIAGAYLVLAFLIGAGMKYFAIPNSNWRGGSAESVEAAIEKITGSTVDQSVSSIEFVRPRWDGLSENLRHDLSVLNQDIIPNQDTIRSNRPFDEREISRIETELGDFLSNLNQRFDELGAKAHGFRVDTHGLDGDLVAIVWFAVEFEKWTLAQKALGMMGRIRTNLLIRSWLGFNLAGSQVLEFSLDEIIGEKEIMGLGGPTEARKLLQPLFLSADEHGVLVTNLATVAVYGNNSNFRKFPKDVPVALSGTEPRFYVSDEGGWKKWFTQKIISSNLDKSLKLSSQIAATGIVRFHSSETANVELRSLLSGPYVWQSQPFTDYSAAFSVVCSRSAGLAAAWEWKFVPLFEKMENELQKQDHD